MNAKPRRSDTPRNEDELSSHRKRSDAFGAIEALIASVEGMELRTANRSASQDDTPGGLPPLLARYAQGDDKAANQLMPLIYDELRRAAQHYMRSERVDHTLQGTALVNEAFLRLSQRTSLPIDNRAHFFRLASQVMRHVLVDHARAKLAQKRGGDVQITSLDQTALDYHEQCAEHLFLGDGSDNEQSHELDLVALDAALEKLRALSERQAQVVDLRFFGSLQLDEIADTLGISIATVKRDWTMARLFLKRELDLARGE